MDTKAVNPWTWQDALAFSQGVETQDARRLLFVAGQASVDAEGNAVHAGDMAAQMNQAFDNLEAVLAQAGLAITNVVRLNYYVTDIEAFANAGATIAARLESLAVKPSGTLLGVSRLYHPELLIEMEATAAA